MLLRRLPRRLADHLGLNARRCASCGAAATDGGLCPECARALAPRLGGFCPTCGAMTLDPDGPISVCADCRLKPPPWTVLIFHAPFEGRLRDLILTYKFQGGLHRSRILADMLVEAFDRRAGADPGLGIPDVITPVPLHPRRLVWRGYNQSLELVRPLARRLDRPVCAEGLTRLRNTPPQTTLNRAEREQNLKGAFRADPDLVRGRSVLLVDDVCTTGSTLRECAKALRDAGAVSVAALVLART